MKEIAAYILLVLGGNATPSAEDVTNVITSSGAEANEASITSLIGDLEGKTLADLLAVGQAQLKSVSGSVAAAPAAAAAGGAAAPKAAEAAPVVKEETVDALEGGMDMFGGGKDY